MAPKILTVFKEKGLNKNQIIKEIMAGVIVAIIALPLSIALGISSGVSPEKGLITAIVAGFIISLLGGSRIQIGGPTAAFVVIVYGIVQNFGINGLIVATMMAGVILIAMGLLKLGGLIRYVPHTITVGFTSGIAITLLVTQLKDLIGLTIENVPAEFIPKIQCYIENINTFDLTTLLIGIGCILLMIGWGKINKSIPSSIIALIVSTVIVQVFNLPVETIGSRFTNLSSTIPMPMIPDIDMEMIRQLIKPAFTIAILAAIESLLSAVVADGMIEDTHDSNAELIAQGLGNIASALFGGIPATGAIARTAANAKNGGRTPIAGIIHAITLLLIMVLFMPFAKMIPMTTLSAVLIVVAYNMGEWSTFKELLRAPKSDVVVLILTFALTVIFDLVVAIEVGMVLSMFLWIRRLSTTTEFKIVKGNKILAYEVNGPFFFGVVQDFIKTINKIDSTAEVLLLDMRHTQAIDASGIAAMDKLYKYCHINNIRLMLVNLKEQPQKALSKMKFIEKLQDDSVFNSKADGLKAANKYLEEKAV